MYMYTWTEFQRVGQVMWASQSLLLLGWLFACLVGSSVNQVSQVSSVSRILSYLAGSLAA